MDYGENKTSDLLQRWKDGDNGALGALLDRHLPWVRRLVHKRLGAGRSRARSPCRQTRFSASIRPATSG